VPFDGSVVSLGFFLLGLFGVALMVSGSIIAGGRKREHWLGGVLLILGLTILAIGWLAPMSQ